MRDVIFNLWRDTIIQQDIKFIEYQEQYEVAYLIFEELLLQKKRETWEKIRNTNLSRIDTYDPLGKYEGVR